jgi:hypothetical protein
MGEFLKSQGTFAIIASVCIDSNISYIDDNYLIINIGITLLLEPASVWLAVYG